MNSGHRRQTYRSPAARAGSHPQSPPECVHTVELRRHVAQRPVLKDDLVLQPSEHLTQIDRNRLRGHDTGVNTDLVAGRDVLSESRNTPSVRDHVNLPVDTATSPSATVTTIARSCRWTLKRVPIAMTPASPAVTRNHRPSHRGSKCRRLRTRRRWRVECWFGCGREKPVSIEELLRCAINGVRMPCSVW